MHSKLEQLCRSASCPQSLLLIANSNESLKSEALDYAKAFLNIQEFPDPDFTLLAPEGKSLLHSVESMRQFRDEVYKPPFRNSRKLFVILEADRMPPVSANALLKAFEEPLPTSYILLCTTNPSRILPTILSRCQKLKIDLQEETSTLPNDVHQFFARCDQMTLLDRMKHGELMTEWFDKMAETPKVKGEDKDLTAQQKEQLEKEQEARTASTISKFFNAYLLEWVSWVRDLHLLKVHGNQNLLYHKSHAPALTEQFRRGFLPSLDHALRSCKQAKISYDRFTPMPTVLFDLWSDVK
ncbi:MAG: hypothetical protein ACK5MA_03760 [Parachlamydiaceae bacterium]